MDLLNADEILGRAQSRCSNFKFADNTVCIAFRLPPKKRYRRLIATVSLHIADFLRVERRIIGGGSGCFWFEQDISGTSQHAFDEFQSFCETEIDDSGYWDRLHVSQIWAASKTLNSKFEVLGNDGKN